MSIGRWRFGDDEATVRAVLERGGLIVFPTESSYAVGADPHSAAAVEAVYRLKERERGKPLGVVVADPAQALALGVRADDPAFRWARRHWPAPLSVLVGTERRLPAMGDADSLMVRVPDHPDLRRLLAAVGPLTATSANRAGESPIVDPREASSWLACCFSRGSSSRSSRRSVRNGGAVACLVIDDGVLPGGAPSTVVSWVFLPQGDGRPEVLRAGRFSMVCEQPRPTESRPEPSSP